MRHGLAHILPDLGVDPHWAPEVDGTVLTLALAADTLYLGGFFTTGGGQPRNRAAAVDNASGALKAVRGLAAGSPASRAVGSGE